MGFWIMLLSGLIGATLLVFAVALALPNGLQL